MKIAEKDEVHIITNTHFPRITLSLIINEREGTCHRWFIVCTFVTCWNHIISELIFLATSWRALSLKQMWSNSTDNHKFQIVDGVQVSTCMCCNAVDDQKFHLGDGIPLCVLIKLMTAYFTFRVVYRFQLLSVLIPVMTTGSTLGMVYRCQPQSQNSTFMLSTAQPTIHIIMAGQ
jgi:hypothetical protein